MPTTLDSVVTKYLRSGSPAQRTREEYATTLRKWSRWGGRARLAEVLQHPRALLARFNAPLWRYAGEIAQCSKSIVRPSAWRSALVVFFNYGVDTGTIWKTLPFHEPILWRHVSWERRSPDREIKELCPWGWLYYPST
jgi:hypothetical protein